MKKEDSRNVVPTHSIESVEQLKAVLEHQEIVSIAAMGIKKIEQLIADKEAGITQAKALVPNLDGLNRTREDLLAAVAAGDATEADLVNFDQDSEVERSHAKLVTEQSAQQVDELQQAIAGLKRKLGQERSKFDQIEVKGKPVLLNLINAETRIAADTYLRAAADLEKAFLHVLGLSRIANLTAGRQGGISFSQIDEIYVPALSAVGFETCKRYPSWPGVVFSGRILEWTGGTKSAVDVERQKLRDAGVNGV